MSGDDVQFALVAEQGVLEAQALLLCESIRLFAGKYRNAPISAVIPRPTKRPSARTLSALARLGVDIVELNVTSAAPEYGTTYRIHSASAIEASSRAKILVFMDSDLVFFGEPDLDLNGYDAAARPVDLKGMCTTGSQDSYDPYWRRLCEVCDVDYSAVPPVTTTVDQLSVKASYNGGFIVIRRSAGIFCRTEEFFERSVGAGLRPHMGKRLSVRAGHGQVDGIGAEYWGSSQACLSLAIWGRQLTARILPPTHNFPLHIDSYVAQFGAREPLIVAHYHHLFTGEQSANPLFSGRLNVPSQCLDWLEGRLPLDRPLERIN